MRLTVSLRVASVMSALAVGRARGVRAPVSLRIRAISAVTRPCRTAFSMRLERRSCWRWMSTSSRMRSSAPYDPTSMRPSPPSRRPTPSRRRTTTSGSGRRSRRARRRRGGTGASWYGSPNMHDLHAAERLGASLPRPGAATGRSRPCRSALTIEISSITSVSIALRILRSRRRTGRSRWSAMTPIGSRNSEWIVCPSTLSAATPVGAQIAICFDVFHARCFSSVDLPVPARPVTKTCSRVSSMSRNTASCSAERAARSPTHGNDRPRGAGRGIHRVILGGLAGCRP